MVWSLIKSVKLTGNATSLDCDFSSEGTKKFLYVDVNINATDVEPQFRFNNVSSGNKYASARRNDFSTTGFTDQNMTKSNCSGDLNNGHHIMFIQNFDGVTPKMIVSSETAGESTGASSIPRISTTATVFYESSQINRITLVENQGLGSSTYNANTEITVFGTDGA
jgi:hypothetical protein|tara:strand:- start:703 stop:1200 length:498 start_codon:yes stop_codon:yes gene_type:complete